MASGQAASFRASGTIQAWRVLSRAVTPEGAVFVREAVVAGLDAGEGTLSIRRWAERFSPARFDREFDAEIALALGVDPLGRQTRTASGSAAR